MKVLILLLNGLLSRLFSLRSFKVFFCFKYFEGRWNFVKILMGGKVF